MALQLLVYVAYQGIGFISPCRLQKNRDSLVIASQGRNRVRLFVYWLNLFI